MPFAQGGFGTPTDKGDFGADSLEYKPPVESRVSDETLRSKYPLELISSKNDNSMNSTFGNRPASMKMLRSCIFILRTPSFERSARVIACERSTGV